MLGKNTILFFSVIALGFTLFGRVDHLPPVGETVELADDSPVDTHAVILPATVRKLILICQQRIRLLANPAPLQWDVERRFPAFYSCRLGAHLPTCPQVFCLKRPAPTNSDEPPFLS
jgi:hypothetical protein